MQPGARLSQWTWARYHPFLGHWADSVRLQHLLNHMHWPFFPVHSSFSSQGEFIKWKLDHTTFLSIIIPPPVFHCFLLPLNSESGLELPLQWYINIHHINILIAINWVGYLAVKSSSGVDHRIKAVKESWETLHLVQRPYTEHLKTIDRLQTGCHNTVKFLN